MEITIPGEQLTAFDIGFVDQQTQRYYLADRSNKAIDVFDARSNTYIGRAPGFVGATLKADGSCCNNAKSGPDGVLIIGNEIWAGDGDSTVKVIDIKTMKIIDTITTGGKLRANEMTYDPKDRIFIVRQPERRADIHNLYLDQPGHKIIGKVITPQATPTATNSRSTIPPTASSDTRSRCSTMILRRAESPCLIPERRRW